MDNIVHKADCLIIGAGLVGAAQAVALAKCGLSSVVVDKGDLQNQARQVSDGRVSAISHASTKVLNYVGVWEELLLEACPIEKIFVSEGKKHGNINFESSELDEPFGYMVENYRLKYALLNALTHEPLIKLCSRVELTEIENQQQVHGVLSNGELVQAELLIVADGRYSTVRDKIGIKARKFEYGQTAIVCNIWHEKSHNNQATEWFFKAGPLAQLPMRGEHHSCIVWSETDAMADYLMRLDEAQFLEELALLLNGAMGEISLSGKRFAYPLNLFQAEKYVAENAVVIGDAAHAIHPIAGQGVNLGYRDVAALTEVLYEAKKSGTSIADAQILSEYQRWRSFDAASMIATTDGLNRLFSNDSKLMGLFRQIGMGLFEKATPVKGFFIQTAMGMNGDLPKILQSETL
jgi:2-octaprenyl-6-methoxyphenol hydroxylase